jgi:hypothetical protein
MENAEHVEWVPTGKFVKGVILATTSLVIIILALIVVFIQPLDFEAIIGIGISLAVLVFISLLFINFRGIRIQITSDKLIAIYGLLNKKSIKFDNIISCKVVKASFGRYGGIGIRYGLDGSHAYTTSLGNAVEITPKKGRTFVFSSNTPDKICKLIERNRNRRLVR